MNKKIIVIGLVLLLTVTVFSGCVDDNKQTTDIDDNTAKTYTINTNYPRDHLGLNDEGETAFTSACNRYSELKASMTDEEARTALVDELNNGFDFVKEASLSEDGYTIAVIFEDDTAALMITYQMLDSEDEKVNTGSQFSMYNTNTKPVENSNYKDKITYVKAEEKYLTPLASEVDASDDCEVDFVVPQSKKVLIINAASLCNPYWSSYEERMVIDSFQENSWTLNDIDIKKRSSLNDGNLTPDDYFDYFDYGIIMYIGHGGYCSGYEGSIPGHHYLECCDIKVNFTSIVGQERLEQYRTWRDQGRLIYGGYYTDEAETEWEWELYIDTDLIMEHAKIDPGTMIYMDSCNSNRAADAYLNNDAGCFFGFDYKADSKASAGAFYALITAMVNEGIAQNGADALNQLSDEIRTSSGGGKLHIYDNGKDVYLPSFGKLVLQPDSPPSGTSYYEIEFLPYGTTENMIINAGEEIEYDGVSPVDTTINIMAKGSTGNIVETGIFKPELRSGENELFTINTWDTYGIILDADPTTVEPDGTSTSTITATLKTWRDTDILEPTGDAILCKEVEFITNLGFFTESEKVYTDQYGKATIEIASNDEGTATIRAIIEEEGVESYKNVQVAFGDVPYSFRLVSWESVDVYDSGFGEPRTTYYHNWRYWLTFKSIEGVEYYKITVKINGQEYVSGGYRDNQEFITDGKFQPTWDPEHIPENAIEDYNNGTRFLDLEGGSHSGGSDGSYNYADINEKQNDLLTFLEGCTVEIEAYTDY
ncbi:MAG: hypothetical protein QCI00_03225 [Candidatus Thermoplasmatota archaeon]|nr:hypothetical protein [Candidatus Thermoplasmatota archaeon]